MYLDYVGDDFRQNYKSDFENFKTLSEFYKNFGTLSLAEVKALGFSDFFMAFDNHYEEENMLELHKILTKEEEQEQTTATSS